VLKEAHMECIDYKHQLIMFKDIIAVYSSNISKRISTLCAQNSDLFGIKADGNITNAVL
jgi:hypothetical protein